MMDTPTEGSELAEQIADMQIELEALRQEKQQAAEMRSILTKLLSVIDNAEAGHYGNATIAPIPNYCVEFSKAEIERIRKALRDERESMKNEVK